MLRSPNTQGQETRAGFSGMEITETLVGVGLGGVLKTRLS